MRSVFLSLVVLAGTAAAAIHDPVHLDSGQVSGVHVSSPEVVVYKGIPFAAPPVGNLRWRAPQAPAHWQGVRNASEFGSICMQATGGARHGGRRRPEAQRGLSVPQRLDCRQIGR